MPSNKKRRLHTTHEKRAGREGTSLRLQMIGAFALFSVIVLAVLWLFQTVLLDDIYKSLKLRDLDKCADSVAQNAQTMDTEALYAYAGDVGAQYEACISIYQFENSIYGRVGMLEIEQHVNAICFIHNIHNDDLLKRMYRNATENSGKWTERISLEAMFGETEGESGENVIQVRLVRNDDMERMILCNTELVPMESTVKTLRVQLFWISGILLAVAVVLAVLLSAKITKPIREMSTEASKLALGNYNVNFIGGNCTETMNLSATLNRAAYELSKLDQMQKDLIANVSHDLRTPLTMIAGYTEAMRDLPGEATPENMQIVIDETKRLTSLVNDMLEVSRYQGGTQVLKIERFNFTEVVRKTLERYAKLREHDGYTITFESDRDVYVEADEGRILQVIYNLINNAVNYTGEDKTVVIRQTLTGDDKNSVRLEVIDTGIGIPEAELPFVWERYCKVNDFHKRANMGTGLGLSIVKNILLLHGAYFGVKSKVGEGSDFWFELKIAEQANHQEIHHADS